MNKLKPLPEGFLPAQENPTTTDFTLLEEPLDPNSFDLPNLLGILHADIAQTRKKIEAKQPANAIINNIREQASKWVPPIWEIEENDIVLKYNGAIHNIIYFGYLYKVMNIHKEFKGKPLPPYLESIIREFKDKAVDYIKIQFRVYRPEISARLITVLTDGSWNSLKGLSLIDQSIRIILKIR